MLLFCPLCSNMLTVTRVPNTVAAVDMHTSGQNRFECRSCPYQYVIKQQWFERKAMKQKEVEDVLGGAEAWENVDKTPIACPSDKCSGTEAFFYTLQIRSADEPMTAFYKCTKCGRQWRE